MIWDALDRNLEPDEKRQIQIIVAAILRNTWGTLRLRKAGHEHAPASLGGRDTHDRCF